MRQRDHIEKEGAAPGEPEGDQTVVASATKVYN